MKHVFDNAGIYVATIYVSNTFGDIESYPVSMTVSDADVLDRELQ